MGLSITGYVLEPPRVGQANSPFTSTPYDFVSNSGAFNAAYPPTAETNPRTDYLVFVGNLDGKLAAARFYWTKNEGAVQSGVQISFARFDYSGKDQRFKTLPGSGPLVLGILGPDSNTTRFKVAVPLLTNFTNFPVRISVGPGSGTTFGITLVTSFGSPASGQVEILTTDGTVNWNPVDFSSYGGQPVQFQQQAFFAYDKSNGRVGLINDVLLLTPKPATGQIPLIRIGYGSYLPTIEVPNDAGLSPAPGQVKWSLTTGRLAFNPIDVTANSGRPVYYDGSAFGLVAAAISVVDGQTVGDVTVDHGITLRLFRTPVDLTSTDPTLNDVTAFYPSVNAILASPIMASPAVFLPAIPCDNRPIAVRCSKISSDLPSLDVPSPPTGVGYVLDFDGRQLVFAQRKANVVSTSPIPFGAVQIDPLVFQSNLLLELQDPVLLTWTPLVIGDTVLFDYQSGLASFVKTEGTLITSGITGEFTSPTGFQDLSANFAAVLPGDSLVVLTGTAKGIYSIDTVSLTALTTGENGNIVSGLAYEIRHDYEVLADRYFRDVPPVDPNTRVERLHDIGAPTNSPRLNVGVDFASVSVSRFRFGKTTFATTVQVATDGAFTTPPQGTIELSLATGNLNFSPADVTAAVHVYWAKTLVLGSDYTLQPPLGFIQFTDRFLTNDEAFVTYKNADGVVVQERGTFIVRKELTDHPTPTGTIPFNPLGHEVADQPAARVFRGGRPQDSTQVSISTSPSTITFLAFNQVTDALPAGPPVDPSEHVYIDYFIYDAIGGEQSITVLQPPMQGVTVQITELDNSNPPLPNNKFTILGDRRADFQQDYLLRVDKSEVYCLDIPTYDGTLTTVTLKAPQTFRSDFTNPGLAVSSGKTRILPDGVYPSYFTLETHLLAEIPRGNSKFTLSGDLSKSYVDGTVVLVTDGSTFIDFLLVTGSVYKDGQTEVTLSGNAIRQYSLTHTLKRSVRPVFPTSQAVATTQMVPASAPTIFRRVEGHPGQVLAVNADYKIDDSGRVTFVVPLKVNEQFAAFYTGHLILDAGRNFRASYTYMIVPSETNFLLGGDLKMDYTTYIPDSFYWRVETMTEFRTELASQYEQDAKASIPSGGPTLENTSSPKLFEQGRESVYFQEGHLANEDLVARPTLKFYNDEINILEDCLQSMDGRVVGDHDGRFKYDGLITNPIRTTWPAVTNQIDDTFKVSDAPYQVSFVPFTFSVTVPSVPPYGTYQKAYEPAPTSRFFPTSRVGFGVVTPTTGINNGDSIMDTGWKKLASIGLVGRREPWAVVTKTAKAGTNQLYVDAAKGALYLFRPSMGLLDLVTIIGQNGTVLVASVGVALVNPTQISLSTFLGVDIPAGSTVKIAPASAFQKFYRPGIDIGVNLDQGLLTYIAPFPPLDGSVPLIPSELWVQTPVGGEILDVPLALFNSITAPDRFPALDGDTRDDDRNRQFPILSPSNSSEDGANYGYLRQEEAVIGSSGTLRAAVTMPLMGTGDLDAGCTTLTNTGGSWPAYPLGPKIGDLVRILTGLNGPSDFHHVTAVGTDIIGLDPPFAHQDSGFQFTITVSNFLVESSGDVTSTTLTDLSTDFVSAGILPGHTVVFESGTFDTLRRQVVSVDSPTQLTIVAVAGSDTGFLYRVDNPLGTFGGTNSIVSVDLIPALNGELAVLDTNTSPILSERRAIEALWNFTLTNVTTSSGTVSGSVLTDHTQDFLALKIGPTHIVFIQTGSNGGFYQVVNHGLITQHTLTVDTPFPVAGAVSYRVVAASLISKSSLQVLYLAWVDIVLAIANVTAFRTLVTTAITVSGDAGAFARGWLLTDLNTRDTQVLNREMALEAVPGWFALVSGVMSSGDHLYDKRFTWIDARINLEKGILVKQQRAVANRIKAQADLLNQLIKLLTVTP